MKRYLFVMRHAPHVSSHVQEALDQLLTTAAFDQTVTVLFLDDGVWQLKQGQDASISGRRDTAAVLQALSLYDVEHILVEQESLQACGLTEADLVMRVRCVLRRDVHTMMTQHDIIMVD